jgi:Peptidase family C25
VTRDRAEEHVMGSAPGVVLVARPAVLESLGPLLAVWDAGAGVEHVPWSALESEGPALLPRLAGRAGAVLVIGPRRRSPRTVLPGPVLLAPDGRVVPVAWLPETCAADLRRFARTAATVHARAGAQGNAGVAATRSLAVLGERHPRFDRLADRIVRIADDRSGGSVEARRCTAYELSRGDLVDHLSGGPAVGLYVGHGRPVGWVGYAGLRAHHLSVAAERPDHRPAAAIVSLTCKTASRRRTGLSFAEALPLAGVAAATVGAVTSTVHTGNARWAMRIASDLGTTRTIGDLVSAVAPHDTHADTYRLIGDPTAPLLDAPTGEASSHPHPIEEAS